MVFRRPGDGHQSGRALLGVGVFGHGAAQLAVVKSLVHPGGSQQYGIPQCAPGRGRRCP